MNSFVTSENVQEPENPEKDFLSGSKALFDCLEPLLQALRWPGSRENLIEVLPHYTNILNIKDFINIMRILNFKAHRVDVPLEKINENLVPCLFISHLGDTWVLLQKKGDSITYYDGKLNKECTIHDNELHLQGTVYRFTYISHAEAQAFMVPGKWFQSLINEYSSLTTKIFLLTLLISLLAFALPFYSLAIYDLVIPAYSTSMNTGLMIGVLLIILASIGVQSINSSLLIYMGSKVDNILSKSIFERLLYLPTFYTENSPVSAQVDRIKDFNNIRDLFTAQLINLFFELPFTLLFLLGIVILGGKLAYIPIVTIFIFVLLIYFFTPLITRFVKDTAVVSGVRQGLILESFQNLRTIKLMAIEDTWIDKYRRASLDYISKNIKSQITTGVINSLSDFLIYVTATLIIGVGARIILEGQLTTGVLIAIMMIVWRVLMPLRTIFNSQIRLRQIYASIQQVNALMGLIPEREPGYLGESIRGLQGKVFFNRVSFRYPNALEYSLFGLTFNVNPGEVVAVIGRNGAGKSSLLNLILGLYKQTSGIIVVDNQDIRQFDPIEYRKCIGYIPQNCQVFYGTVAQNICLTKITATREEMEEAARKADLLEDIVALPDGFETRLGDQLHSKLHPSFLKRIALARMYLKEPSIILLDEPTDLDQKGDMAVTKMLEHFRNKATIFLVTHRPSHFGLADKILLLHEGQLVLYGPADQVIKSLPGEFLGK